jgi:hypothetical protein
MSDYGDNFSLCNSDEQRQAYIQGWNDAKAGQNNEDQIGAFWIEFYRFGQLDANS